MNAFRELARRILYGPRVRPREGEFFLDLGCGAAKQPGCVGVDLRRVEGVDVVADLRGGHYPFAEDSVDGVVSYHLVEHLEDLTAVLVEMHRIVRTGGRVHLETPHYASWSSWADVTHRHHLGVNTVYRLAGEGHWEDNLSDLYWIRRVYLRYGVLGGVPVARLLGLEALVNLAPAFLERVGWAHLPPGGIDLCIDLEVKA